MKRRNQGQYAGPTVATIEDLRDLLVPVELPVVLLEGTRALPAADVELLVTAGASLARRFPRAVFRTGNAEGSDTAFAQGVASVDPVRLEYILPNPGMGKSRRVAGSRPQDLTSLPVNAETRLFDFTVRASPDTERLVGYYREKGPKSRSGAKAAYLLRDTLKVTGAPELGLAPAVAGIFYVNRDDPLSGGTGHTIWVCAQLGVPTVLQPVWEEWL